VLALVPHLDGVDLRLPRLPVQLPHLKGLGRQPLLEQRVLLERALSVVLTSTRERLW